MGAAVNPPGGTVVVDVVEIKVSEALDKFAVLRLRDQLERILAVRPRNVVIDLAGCLYVDAAVIALLLDVHSRLWRADGLLTLRAPTPRVRRTLQTARVDRVLHIISRAAQMQRGMRPNR